MRHLLGLGLAVATAAAVFFGAGWAVERLTVLSAHNSSLTSSTALTALAAVLGTGLLIGLLTAVPWVSPLAPGLPGLALLGWTAYYMLNPHRAVSYIPFKSFGFAPGFADMLTSGVLAVAGMAMIVPFFLPSRWRRPAVGDREDSDLPEPLGLLQ
ncbi:MAG TPA: hypothetical protein VGS62_01520 [Streptosporangiaceae bacterium]|nr:hypothetical protein [Streptosporangiaceae bacterium]